MAARVSPHPGGEVSHTTPDAADTGIQLYRNRVSQLSAEEDPMSEKTTCIVVGGGPAGMVAALLLARGGVEVTVLEKHADFLRDFRGDTVHPSTLRLLDELGLFGWVDALAHTKLEG